MKLAKDSGSNASPRSLSLPSLSFSALSLMTASSAGPRGIRFKRATNSDSWYANFTWKRSISTNETTEMTQRDEPYTTKRDKDNKRITDQLTSTMDMSVVCMINLHLVLCWQQVLVAFPVQTVPLWRLGDDSLVPPAKHYTGMLPLQGLCWQTMMMTIQQRSEY